MISPEDLDGSPSGDRDYPRRPVMEPNERDVKRLSTKLGKIPVATDHPNGGIMVKDVAEILPERTVKNLAWEALKYCGKRSPEPTEPKYTALTESEQKFWQMGYDKRGEEFSAGDREAAEKIGNLIAAHIIGGSFYEVTSDESRAALSEIKTEIAAALSAARGEGAKEWCEAPGAAAVWKGNFKHLEACVKELGSAVKEYRRIYFGECDISSEPEKNWGCKNCSLKRVCEVLAALATPEVE